MSDASCPQCGKPMAASQARRFGAACPDCMLRFVADDSPPEFPNLEIVSTLGRGGMGVVYEAIQPLLGRRVALKVLSPHLAFDKRFMARFQAEARMLAKLQHPNIVTVHDIGIHGELPYIVLEKVDGRSLREMLSRGALPPGRALAIAADLCRALAHAHAAGVVHRDVKPENVLIDRSGWVKLADFGLATNPEARVAEAAGGTVRLGTPRYMAPEQLEHPDQVDGRADLYSVGRIVIEMWTGKLPPKDSRSADLSRAAPPKLAAVLRKLLASEPERRWRRAEEVADALDGLASSFRARRGGSSGWSASRPGRGRR
jgi:serine/threonine protein kinase